MAQTMTPADSAWLHMDSRTNLMVINAVLWFDEPLDWERARATFMERVVERFPRFRRRVREGLPGRPPAWCDDPGFDPDLHFHRLALPAPGDRAVLQEVVSDVIVAPLDRARPLWDVYLLEGYGNGCALLVRMHHAIADGIALARVLLSLTDDAGGHPVGFADEPGGNGRGPAAIAAELGLGLARQGAALARSPRRAATELARAAARDGRALAKLLAPGRDTSTPLRGDLAIGHRIAWSEPVSLARIKRTGHATGTTVNDVLVAALSGALGSHLRDRGAPTDTLHALVPFNLRPLSEPLPRDLGNRFGLLLLELPVGIEDPRERLAAVQERMGRIKTSHEGPIAYGILGLIGRTPLAVERQLIRYFTAKGSMVLTNVPGPRAPVTFAGSPVGGVMVWAPCSGSVGMSISIFSYAGKVTVGFLVDRAIVDDPQQLADGFRAELLALTRTAPRNGRGSALPRQRA
jgi:diacylglycerol O-acyltransferase / wax synthase